MADQAYGIGCVLKDHEGQWHFVLNILTAKFVHI